MTLPRIPAKSQHGFTLIELSIVLVIIGLIVGGVLVGQDLIKAAQIRATVGQYEKYNAAVNTFRGKYNGIPGDLPQPRAVSFGFYYVTGGGASGTGDGNGLIQSLDAPTTYDAQGEPVIFWRHLSQANLVDGAYGVNIDGAGAGSGTGIPDDTSSSVTVGSYFPATKSGRGNVFLVYADTGRNAYEIAQVTAIATGAYTAAAGLTPIESLNIDSKVDDGQPLTGIVRATAPATAINTLASAAAQATTICILTGGTYAVNTSGATASGNNPNCGLRLRFN